VKQIACLTLEDPPIIALRTRDLSLDGIAVEPSPQLARAGRVHLVLASKGAGESLLVWANLVRSGDESMALRFDLPEDTALRRRLASFVEGLGPTSGTFAKGHAPA
jgi:hypothetical protein